MGVLYIKANGKVEAVNKGGGSVDLSGYAQKSELPTKVSQLQNDKGYLTEHQDISGKLDASALPTAINTALAQAKASGEFDGKDGSNGKDGVSATHTWNGTTLIVTSASGTSSANLKGDKGDTGAAGSAGKDGSNGKDGTSATHSWNGTTLTITSASGTSSADLKGDKGDKGEKGDTGATGATGPAGADGAKGDKGDKGDVGDTGPVGPRGIQGERGPKGDTGEKGETGDPGLVWKGQYNEYNAYFVGDVVSLYGSCYVAVEDNGGDNPSDPPNSYNGFWTLLASKGNDGKDGTDGKTPVKGTDYFTAADKADMVAQVIAALPVYAGEVV